MHTPALEILDQALVDAAEGRNPWLIFTMSPQEGKSQRVSRNFPLWLLVNNPHLRVAVVSYADALARRWGRVVRNDIREHSELGLTIRADTGAAKEWQVDGYDGGIITAGIGSGLTGRPVDCLVGSTQIVTEHGYAEIRDLYQSSSPPRVLTWNHAASRTEWQPIQAARRIRDREIVEVVTTAGRRIRCTPDHLIHTEDGYRPAALLRPGDALQIGWQDSNAGMPDVREGQKERRRDLPQVLSRAPGTDLPADDLQDVRVRVFGDAGRGRKAAASWPGQLLLRNGVRRAGAAEPRSPMSALLEADRIEGSWPPLLLGAVSPRGSSHPAQREGLPAVRHTVPGEEQPNAVLRETLRRPCPFDPYGRGRQLALSGRHELRDMVSQDETTDSRTRRPLLPGVPQQRSSVSGQEVGCHRDAQQSAYPSHRRTAAEQHSGEPDLAVQDMPRGAPQVGRDTVSVVRAVRGERHDVYDLQVAGNHNFFAEEILVHNCLIIDDPLKDQKEADSETIRQTCKDFWQTTASSRLSETSIVIVVMTRWHEDDLAGWLMENHAQDFVHINIPAQAEHDPAAGEADILGREPGEYMISARARTHAGWEKRKRSAGSRGWNALYQGRPAPQEGGIFKRHWWIRYRYGTRAVQRSDGTMHALGAKVVIQTWDMAFKDTDGSDFVCGQVWAASGSRAWLLDQICERLEFTETVDAVVALSAKWPQAKRKYIEDKANGPAVISALRGKVGGIIPYTPVDSKLARARSIAPFVEAGDVEIPEDAPWTQAYVEQHAAFPNGANDDMVDDTSLALIKLLLEGLGNEFMEELTKEQGGQFRPAFNGGPPSAANGVFANGWTPQTSQ